MAEFSKLVITKKGQALIAKVLAGTAKDVEFTKTAASKAAFTVDELELLSALPDVMQEAEISHKSRINEVAVQIETAFNNSKLTVGYPMNTLGLFAVDPDEGEILYAACAELSGYCYMPPYNGITVSGAFIRMITTVGSADRVSLEVNPAVTATFADIKRLERQIDEIKALMSGVQIIQNFTIPAGGWLDASTVEPPPEEGEWPLYMDVPHGDSTELAAVSLNLDNLPSKRIAAAAGLCPSAYAGEGIVRFWCRFQPERDVTGTLTLLYPTGPVPVGYGVATPEEAQESLNGIFGG